jgi:polar amino acid transport system substrate-binding protein
MNTSFLSRAMKRLLIAFVVSLVLAQAVFASAAKEQTGLTKTPGVLTIGVDFTYRPMEYYINGDEPAGFDVDFAKALAAKMGLSVTFVNTAWDGIFAGINRNDYDCIISSVTMSEARVNAYNFSKPYIANSLSLCMPDGSQKLASLSDIAGKRIAYQIETTSDIYLTDYIKNNKVSFQTFEYDGMMQCFDELALGRVDAVLTDTLVAVDYVNDGVDIVWEGSDLGEYFGICIKKGNDALTAAIDQALAALFDDGTMTAISKEIFAGVDMVSAAHNAW